MRKFRNAALAGMTAVTLVAGMTSTAIAEDATADYPGVGMDAADRPTEGTNNNQPECVHDFDLTEVKGGNESCTTKPLDEDLKNQLKNPSNSSVFGERWNADRDVTGRNMFGLVKNFGEVPVWAQIWYVATVLGVVGSVIGLGWLPVMNQLKNQGIIV